MAGSLVIVGGGMAAGRLVEQLVEHGYAGHVTVVSEEAVVSYNRVLLPGLVSGSCNQDALITHPPAWFHEHGIDLVLGRRAVALDPAARRLTLEGGHCIDFDQLVLATGARAPLPDIPGVGLAGVTALRCLADAERVRGLATSSTSAVVVGGGLLGLETAQSLLDLGLTVHVLHRHPRLLNRQLDEPGARLLARTLERRGMTLLLGAEPVALLGTDRVTGVTLHDAASDATAGVPADLVVFATGTRPSDSLAADAGIACDTGVLVDDTMQTSMPGVYAIGECARVTGHCFALVEPVFRQADALARVLTGGTGQFAAPPAATRLKVSGIDVFSGGEVNGGGTDEVCVSDPARGLYRRLWFRQGALVGAVLLGDAAGSHWIQQLMDGGQSLGADEQRSRLAFGLAPAAQRAGSQRR